MLLSCILISCALLVCTLVSSLSIVVFTDSIVVLVLLIWADTAELLAEEAAILLLDAEAAICLLEAAAEAADATAEALLVDSAFLASSDCL
jgi:hypothetical protein